MLFVLKEKMFWLPRCVWRGGCLTKSHTFSSNTEKKKVERTLCSVLIFHIASRFVWWRLNRHRLHSWRIFPEKKSLLAGSGGGEGRLEVLLTSEWGYRGGVLRWGATHPLMPRERSTCFVLHFFVVEEYCVLGVSKSSGSFTFFKPTEDHRIK